MKPTSHTSWEDPAEPTDLLTMREEEVLATVREILDGLKVGGAPVDLKAVKTAFKHAGADATLGEGDPNRSRCNFDGTCFLFRRGPRGGIEICFVPKSQ